MVAFCFYPHFDVQDRLSAPEKDVNIYIMVKLVGMLIAVDENT